MEYRIENDELQQVNDAHADYNPGKDFMTLEAWKKSRLVKLFFYNEVIPGLPAEEKFNLDIQIRKASVSIYPISLYPFSHTRFKTLSI